MNEIHPKVRFLSDPQRADKHQEIMLSPEFKAAAESAMCELVYGLDLQNGSDALLIRGARLYLKTLLNLGERSLTNQPVINENLTAI